MAAAAEAVAVAVEVVVAAEVAAARTRVSSVSCCAALRRTGSSRATTEWRPGSCGKIWCPPRKTRSSASFPTPAARRRRQADKPDNTGYIRLDLNTMELKKLPKNQLGGLFSMSKGAFFIVIDLN
jgi:hypothetical protein